MDYLSSWDGGGTRGTIEACICVAIESQFTLPLREIFKYAGGTSTGALISWAISLGIPASRILEIYTKRCKEIFNHSSPIATEELFSRGWSYDSDNIRRVLEDEAGDKKSWTMNDSPIGILLTGYGCDGHIWYFTRDTPTNSHLTGKLSMIDCAVASASAPTVFSPKYVSPLGGKLIGPVFDGGVAGYANPCYRVVREATDFDVFSPDPLQTRLISIGSGYFNHYSSIAPEGLLATIKIAFRGLLDSANDEQSEIVTRHYPNLMQRFNWELPREIDEADTSAIPEMVEWGAKWANQIDWTKIITL